MLKNFSSIIFSASPTSRKFVLGCIDGIILFFSTWLSLSYQEVNFDYFQKIPIGFKTYIFVLILGLSIYLLSNQYKSLTRHIRSSSIYNIASRNLILTTTLFLLNQFLTQYSIKFKIFILFWILLTSLTTSFRLILRDLLINSKNFSRYKRKRIAIYGAGSTGAQLSSSINLTDTHKAVLFIDDNPKLKNLDLNGIVIISPDSLFEFIDKFDELYIAISSLKISRRRAIFKQFQSLKKPVLEVPSIQQISSGAASINSLRTIQIEDLLGRDPVSPYPELLSRSITNAIVCVTGAGGSIGFELCRQILELKPKALILFEMSEPSLYSIHQELKKMYSDKIEILPILGNATNFNLLKSIMISKEVDILFHAAAYKHVPLVESNPLEGIYNNVFSTKAVCSAALSANLKQVVFISTDKAVRPSNVMGASKRLAELVVQAFATESKNTLKGEHEITKFSLVRFGNVLGSSGSVVPLFKKQIASGGPLTITNSEIIRYFMTISEAVELVLQSSALAEGGDLFILEMGEPVKILSLAKEMIRLSGLTVRDNDNPDGDIAITYTGLRPGEKLYEELLIDAKSIPTEHPRIFRAKERCLQPNELWDKLNLLETAIINQDREVVFQYLFELVEEWKNESVSC